MMEAQLVMGRLLQRVRPEVPAEHQPRMKSELSNHPEGGLPVVVRLRTGASTVAV